MGIKRAWLLLCVVLAGCGGGGDCLSGVSAFASEVAAQQAQCGEVTAPGAVGGPIVLYTVSGTASSVDLTYSNATAGTEQRTVALPWSATFRGTPGNHLYLSAQNTGDTGSITVTISVDGRTRKTSTSSGAFVIASASDSCC